MITSVETLSRRQVLAVRVRTAAGAVGTGQCAPYRTGITERVLHELVAPVFLGTEVHDLAATTERCYREHYKFLGSFLNRAVAGVETAVWDLAGRAAGLPVHALLGDAGRTRLPVYLSSMERHRTPEQEVAHLAAQLEATGASAVKVRVGAPMGQDVDAWPGRTEALVPAVRRGLGDGVSLRADANGGYSVRRAVEVGRLLEDHAFVHFEEPCPYTDTEATRAVTAALDVPVAGGEQDTSVAAFARMLSEQQVDVVQPDVAYLGGVARTVEVARLAEAAGAPCTPHCANRTLLQVFTAHVAAALPACHQPQEYSAEEVGWAADVYEPLLVPRDGHLTVPDEPGWGVRLTSGFLAAASSTTTTQETTT